MGRAVLPRRVHRLIHLDQVKNAKSPDEGPFNSYGSWLDNDDSTSYRGMESILGRQYTKLLLEALAKVGQI